MKRYLIYPTNFDARSYALEEPGPEWVQEAIDLHLQNRARLIESLKVELGEHDFEAKLQNFRELGTLPFSIIAHHNYLFIQARYAFIHGFYYPALTGACALGERILNHLVLDLRDQFPVSSFDKKSHTRESISDWMKAIDTLNEWNVFLDPKVRSTFEELMVLRHKSLHFNSSTLESIRGDALSALKCLAVIIEKQFGFLFNKIIPGSTGFFFLQKAAETTPFIKFYYLGQSAHVTPYFAMDRVDDILMVFDHQGEDFVDVTDAEFIEIFNARSLDQLTSTAVPWAKDVKVVAMLPGRIADVRLCYDIEIPTENTPNGHESELAAK